MKLQEAVLTWWAEHKFDTINKGGEEYNLFDEEPEMVTIAKAELALEEEKRTLNATVRP